MNHLTSIIALWSVLSLGACAVEGSHGDGQSALTAPSFGEQTGALELKGGGVKGGGTIDTDSDGICDRVDGTDTDSDGVCDFLSLSAKDVDGIGGQSTSGVGDNDSDGLCLKSTGGLDDTGDSDGDGLCDGATCKEGGDTDSDGLCDAMLLEDV